MARLPFRFEARQVLEDERTEEAERLSSSMRTFARLLRKFLVESISLLNQSKEREFDLMEIHSRNVVSVAFVVSICVRIFGLTFSQEVSKLLEPLLDAFEFRHCVASLKYSDSSLLFQTMVQEPLTINCLPSSVVMRNEGSYRLGKL
jgi:hypothetical protein